MILHDRMDQLETPISTKLTQIKFPTLLKISSADKNYTIAVLRTINISMRLIEAVTMSWNTFGVKSELQR